MPTGGRLPPAADPPWIASAVGTPGSADWDQPTTGCDRLLGRVHRPGRASRPIPKSPFEQRSAVVLTDDAQSWASVRARASARREPGNRSGELGRGPGRPDRRTRPPVTEGGFKMRFRTLACMDPRACAGLELFLHADERLLETRWRWPGSSPPGWCQPRQCVAGARPSGRHVSAARRRVCRILSWAACAPSRLWGGRKKSTIADADAAAEGWVVPRPGHQAKTAAAEAARVRAGWTGAAERGAFLISSLTRYVAGGRRAGGSPRRAGGGQVRATLDLPGRLTGRRGAGWRGPAGVESEMEPGVRRAASAAGAGAGLALTGCRQVPQREALRTAFGLSV